MSSPFFEKMDFNQGEAILHSGVKRDIRKDLFEHNGGGSDNKILTPRSFLDKQFLYDS